MGQTLSEPVVDKHSTNGGDERYIYGASAMQGWRISMEDAHTTVLRLGPEGEAAFFAVYDGHGGQTAAKFAGADLHDFIIKDKNYAAGDYAAAIKAGYLTADRVLQEKPEMTNDSSGCTAVCVLLAKDGSVYCGNAGDSRCIISTKGRAVALSHDHKPSDEIEFNRITSGGGFVEFGRVNGNLALSRAIGDFEFKNNRTLPAEKQIVTADPDVIKHELAADDEFLVIACDGIWDCMNNQQVVQFVHAKIAAGKKLDRICEEMMDECMAGESELGGVGCDNMTVVIVALLNGKTEEEWYAHVKSVADEAGLKASPKISKGSRGSSDPSSEESNALINAILSRVAQSPNDAVVEDDAKLSGVVDVTADVPDANIVDAVDPDVADEDKDVAAKPESQ
ncbi:Protein phosphatase 2C 2 [Coemansia aciculifera]|uniref:protein-serine/threonine phosphatase n=2 Tax=Coemansia TaxID=4863 RepID=A0A9W8LCD2_9FUNG|nr:Protein phosphatase 2C 2 [Coemansia pectinata]KAJ2865980.1 Protein phosphatase 2C 2 [Coemansia aciculifera]KAJ2877236.1 Protein phosphatase 2C 2 [Coemansia aciculifera]